MAKPAFSILHVGVLVVATSPLLRGDEPIVPSRSAADLAAWLDATFESQWTEKGTVAAMVDDATFLRRVYLDVTGTIPTVAQARDFLDDENERKREYLVDRLLTDNRSPQHFSRVWRRILVPGNTPQAAGATSLEPWLQRQFTTNVAYDEFARRLVTGKTEENGPSPMTYYQSVGGTADTISSSVTRVFLGVRIGCAKCHNHPFAEWKQSDFWGMAAFFAGTNWQQGPGLGGNNNNALQEKKGPVKITPENSTSEFAADVLFGETPTIPGDKFPREIFAQWLTARDNPNFSATAVNRVWQQLCGQGLIPHVDDLDQAAAEERAKVLDPLAGHFAEAKYDLKWLIGGICKSKVYQRASEGSDSGVTPLDPRRPLKSLSPEQVYDALEQALMLPVSRADDSPRYNGQRTQVIARLNEAFGDSPDQFKAGIPQALLLMNGALISKATDLDASRTLRAVVEAPFLPAEEKIATLYLAAFTRRPSDEELKELIDHVQSQAKEDRAKAYGEVFWALLNSPEFVLCR